MDHFNCRRYKLINQKQKEKKDLFTIFVSIMNSSAIEKEDKLFGTVQSSAYIAQLMATCGRH